MRKRLARRILVVVLLAALLTPAFTASAAPGREGLGGAFADRLLGLLESLFAFSTSEPPEEEPPPVAVPEDDGNQTTTGEEPGGNPQLGPWLDPDG